MALLSSLTLENFRTFRERTTFDLAPLTILTGPNSSGKSSVLKGLLLLRHNALLGQLHEPTFVGGDHGLGSFDGALSRGATDPTITFGLAFDWGEQESGEFEYTGLDGIARDTAYDIGYVHFELAYRKFDDFPRFVGLHRLRIATGPRGEQAMFEAVGELAPIALGTTSVRPHLTENGDVEPIEEEDYEHGVVYDVTIHGEWFFDDAARAIEELGLSLTAETSGLAEALGAPLRFRVAIPSASGDRLIALDRLIDLACDVRRWDDWDVPQPVVESPEFGWALSTFFRRYFTRWVDYLNAQLADVDHVGPLRSAGERVYADDSPGPLPELLSRFEVPLRLGARPLGAGLLFMGGSKKEVQRLRRLAPLLHQFGLGGIEVDRLADAGYSIRLGLEGEARPLADLGYGYSQLLPLLLYAALDEEGFPTLLVEEPEANLHPNLQARLADLFAGIAEPAGRHVFVETHSEYLIRRLQYLVAKGDADRKRITIYYLGADPTANDYVRRIEIDRYGQLSQEFGPGFFDEATNLMVDLFKYGASN